MGTFEPQQARQRLGFVPSTAVPANIQVPNTGTGGAVGQALVGLAHLKIQYDIQQSNVEFSKFKNMANKEITELEIRRAGNLNPDEYEKDYAETIKRIEGGLKGRNRTVQAGQLWLEGKKPEWGKQSIAAQMARSDDNWDTEFFKTAARIQSGDTEALSEAESMIRVRQLGPRPMDKSKAAKLLMGARDANKKGSIDNIKPNIITAVATGSKNDAIKLINRETSQLWRDGVLTKAEAAEANKILGDWTDNYVAGRIESTKNAVKMTTQQTYQELLPMMFDPSAAQGRYDAIEQSNLLKDDKIKWMGGVDSKNVVHDGYIKGSYTDPATVNTPEGFRNIIGDVLDANTLTISPKEAYDSLMNEYFNKKSITKKQFEWGLSKIQNPYPKQIIPDIDIAIKNNYTLGINRWDLKEKTRVNEKLLGWVDDLIETDSVPKFDFGKKLYSQSSYYRWGENSGLEIGRIMTRGGEEWEVTEFDKNGEPVWEKIR